MTEPEAKLKFAELMLKHPGDPRRCAEILAYSVGIADVATVHRIAVNWQNDQFVMDECARLLEVNGPEYYLPSKLDLARKVWGIVDGRFDPKDQLSAAKQYAELMGFVEKPGTNVTVNVNRVMQVKDYGTDDEWEQKALAQQRRVIEHQP